MLIGVMKNYLIAGLLAAASLFRPSYAFAQSIRFECKPIQPPLIQGDERFAKIAIEDGGQKASLLVAGLAGPFKDVTSGFLFRRAFYSHDESSAFADWTDHSGKEMVSVYLAYFGTWWGAIIKLNAISEELELRCEEIRV